MRWRWLVAAALLAGCVGADPEPACACDHPEDGPVAGPGETRPGGTPPEPAPRLAPGLALTYALDGVYNRKGDVTVVVARAGPEGALLAGAKEADVQEAALWGRAWQGEVDANLSSEGFRLFDFPLTAGKRWEVAKGLPVVAWPGEVKVPGGAEPGWIVSAVDPARRLTYAYAPSLGMITEYASGTKDVVYQRATLKSVGRASSWVWFEAGAAGSVESQPAPAVGPVSPGSPPGPPEEVEVPAGADAILVSAGGTAGHVVIEPPPEGAGPPWTWSAEDEETWTYATLPATPGSWTLLAGAPGETGFSFGLLVAVKYVRGSVEA